jgi:hypothetical protein
MKITFLYHDKPASQKTIDSYIIGDYIHENDHVTASTLRGGLLTGCNLRYIFLSGYNGEDVLVNDDYKRQGFFMFDHTLYYHIYDNYKVGQYAQVLLSPDFNWSDELTVEVIKAARADFNQLLHTRPVPVLDTPDWHRRLGSHPLGVDGKRPHHKLLAA